MDEWRRLHPLKPVQTVAGNLGAPARTVEKWFSGQACPSLVWVGPIFSAYGPEFLVAGMRSPPAWLREAARQEKRRRLAAVRAAVDSEFSDLEYAELEA
ncbi:hypothetical protein [Methylobacterium durans]|uniref:Uncharacterized protein n=1 Tax=Methylobacterium durans TaxID=2202825 RepID=A0A2U8WAT5_9HYPH|nr:hypothetical protein [Methylobacterium durans]AWN43139.1 hypothetical protein DK389_24905 [Methylobacterium durans]